MSYKPPCSRMRQIHRNAPPPIPRFPQNVDDAVREAALKQKAGEEVADEIRVPVGILDAVIKPGPDKVYGTKDDVATIEAHKDDGEHDHEPEVVEPEPDVVEKPVYSRLLKKAELTAIADEHGVILKEDGTKAQIITALDAHFG